MRRLALFLSLVLAVPVSAQGIYSPGGGGVSWATYDSGAGTVTLTSGTKLLVDMVKGTSGQDLDICDAGEDSCMTFGDNNVVDMKVANSAGQFRVKRADGSWTWAYDNGGDLTTANNVELRLSGASSFARFRTVSNISGQAFELQRHTDDGGGYWMQNGINGSMRLTNRGDRLYLMFNGVAKLNVNSTYLDFVDPLRLGPHADIGTSGSDGYTYVWSSNASPYEVNFQGNVASPTAVYTP